MHKNKWAGWNSTNIYLKNKYALKGWGVATDISVFNFFTVQISHSQKIMGNSGEDTNGLDVDGLRWNDRTLITLRKDF